jgi:alkylhydroperoxidase/carboxymuconolactone decarboxylase family protein YurZ
LAPDAHDDFRAFGEKVFAEGALSTKTKQLIAVAVTRCAMSGGAYAHSLLAIEEMEKIGAARVTRLRRSLKA